MPAPAPQIYAIDFGTSNSLLAGASCDRVTDPVPLDPSAPDPSILRSVLYFPNADRCFYGREALNEYTAQDMQGRLMRSLKKYLPSRSFVGTYVDERPMNLEDLIGAMLGEMRRRADRYFQTTVRRVVLGRPARFARDSGDDRFAQGRLEQAARLGGFEEVRFCPEPLAAAREFRAALQQPRLVLVADFGGGTSDFTVLRMRSEGYSERDILAIDGLAVAGDAFDASLMRHHVARHFGADVTYRVPMGSNVLRMPPALMEKICTPADASLMRQQDAMDFLRNLRHWSVGGDDQQRIDNLLCFVEDRLGFSVFEAIERCKRALSEQTESVFRYSYPTMDIEEPITRDAFEVGAQSNTTAILEKLDTTLRSAGVSSDEVDVVCCTGGTARVPAVARGLQERFGEQKLHQFKHFHSVITGLSEHARAWANEL